MIYTGILEASDKIRKAIQEQMTAQPKTSPPVAQEKLELSQTPPEVDYAQGMVRPQISTVAKNMKFEGTPNRSSAFLVALGNILQDRNNVTAANESGQTKDYEARLADALDLNKLQKQAKISADFKAADPMTQLLIKEKQSDVDLIPTREESAKIDLLMKKGRYEKSQQQGGSSGVRVSQEQQQTMPTGFKAILYKNADSFDPNTKEPILTPELIKRSFGEFMLTNPAPKERVAAKEFVGINTQKKPSAFDAVVQDLIDTGSTLQEAYKTAKQAGHKPEKTYAQMEEESRARARGGSIGSMEGIEAAINPEAKPPAPQPIAPTKVINGVTYQKVNGGWKAIK